jgi:hypothetical protein
MCPFVHVAPVSCPLHPVCVQVRAKLTEDLTEEERRWMSMDRVINPELYLERALDEPVDDDASDGAHTRAAQRSAGGGVLCAARAWRGGVLCSPSCLLCHAALTHAHACVQHGSLFPACFRCVCAAPADDEVQGASQPGRRRIVVSSLKLSRASGSHKLSGKVSVASTKKSKLTQSALDRVLPPCDYSRSALVRIRDVPLQQLDREERELRRLFAKFHDRVWVPTPYDAKVAASTAAAAANGSGSGGEGLAGTVSPSLALDRLQNHREKPGGVGSPSHQPVSLFGRLKKQASNRLNIKAKLAHLVKPSQGLDWAASRGDAVRAPAQPLAAPAGAGTGAGARNPAPAGPGGVPPEEGIAPLSLVPAPYDVRGDACCARWWGLGCSRG